mgnify:FL=1
MELIARLAAAKLGLNRFYTGRPCGYGHDAERLVSNGSCCKCSSDRAAIYAKKTRDEIRRLLNEAKKPA